jgi:MFS family permease
MMATEAGPGRRARMAAAWRSGPLGAPAFRLLTAGQFTSTIGDYCYAVALPWLILSNHGGADQLGAVLACYGIPRAALTVPGGSLADRLGPRRVMLGSDAARCGLAAVFAVFAARHVSSLAALAPVAAARGGCSAVFLPASYAIMPSLLSAERLPGANAVYAGVLQVGSLLGPVIGGVAVVAAGPAAAFGADAASYAVSAVSLALIGAVVARRAPAGADSGPDSGSGAGAGPDVSAAEPAGLAGEPAASVWGLLLRARILQIILLVSVTANFALTGSTEVALPALAHARFGAGGYGALLTCVAVGSLTGTLIVAKAGGRARPAMSLGAVFLVAAVAIGLTPFLGGLPGAAAAMLVFGIAIGFDSVLSVTLLQQWAPPGMLGRVMGLVMLASVGSFPLSAAIAGVLTRHLGPSPVFPIAGVLLAAAVLAALTRREFRNFGIHVQSDTSDELASDPAAP